MITEIEQLRAERDEIRERHDALWEMDRKIIADLGLKLAELDARQKQSSNFVVFDPAILEDVTRK